MYYICKHLYFSCENVDIYENVNIRLMEPVFVDVKRKAFRVGQGSDVSEGIQNVIFNLMNTSVVRMLQHTELTEMSLPKAEESICIGGGGEIIYACIIFLLLKLALPAFPHNKHTTFFAQLALLSPDRHPAQCRNTHNPHNLSGRP